MKQIPLRVRIKREAVSQVIRNTKDVFWRGYNMVCQKVKIKNPAGLHLRPAGKFMR